jgi:hypothetical protein
VDEIDPFDFTILKLDIGTRERMGVTLDYTLSKMWA